MKTKQSVVETDLGPITLVAEDGALTGVYFAHHRPAPAGVEIGSRTGDDGDVTLQEAAAQLQAYLAGDREDFDVPVRAAGNEFQQRVWQAVSRVPFGQTTTYGKLALDLGDRALAQQVGQALAANPLCIVVPCHRVVGKDGALTGYAGGLRRKRQLLDLEQPEQERLM